MCEEELFFRGKLYRGTPFFLLSDNESRKKILQGLTLGERQRFVQAIQIINRVPNYPEHLFGKYVRGVFLGVRENTDQTIERVFIPFFRVAQPNLLRFFYELLEKDGMADQVALTAIPIPKINTPTLNESE